MREPHEQIKNGNVVRFLKDYWFIVVAIIGMAMAWASLEAQVKAGAIINEKQQSQIENIESDLNVLDKKYIEDVATIKTQLSQIAK